jgi:hypothetical protein
MPDITMCPGGSCPMKENCYRFKAQPSEFRQAWFTNPPWKEGTDIVDFYPKGCEYYIPSSVKQYYIGPKVIYNENV